jgi:hypothetical protein
MKNEEIIKREFSKMCKELNLDNTMDFGIVNAEVIELLNS